MPIIRDDIVAFEAQWKPLTISKDDTHIILKFVLPPSELEAALHILLHPNILFSIKAKIDGYANRDIEAEEKVTVELGFCEFFSLLCMEERDSILQLKAKFEHFKLGTDERERFEKANLLIVLKDGKEEPFHE